MSRRLKKSFNIMHREIDFNDNNFREVCLAPAMGESLDLTDASFGNKLPDQSPFKNFETVAKNFLNKDKIMDKKEMNASSISFQQEMIKNLAAIGKDPRKTEKFWAEYRDLVGGYIRQLSDEKDKAEAKTYFNSLKRSIIGSVAVIRFFDGQGLGVKFPTIEEDGRKKCDLMFEFKRGKNRKFNLGVQVKSHHLADISREEERETVNRLILTKTEELNGKDQSDFAILGKHCESLSQREKKPYFPIFINMPVTKESETRRRNIIQLVDAGGKANNVLARSLEAKWGEKKKALGIDDI